MLKEMFQKSLKISKFTRSCMENHSSMNGWQKLFFSYKSFQFSVAVAITTFEIYVVVQFYPWFKFCFLSFQTHYHVIIMHYHNQKQKKRKFEPRIKLNHNIYTVWLKIYRLPNFNILFQLTLTRFFKSEFFFVFTES